MPAVTATKSMLSKYAQAGIDSAISKHAGDETNFGVIRMPPGVSNGIAQLISCKFDAYKTGKYEGEIYFQMRGTAVSPKSVMTKDGEQPVAGLQTMVQLPVGQTVDTQGKVTTLEENVAKVLNELRKMGVDTSTAKKLGDLDMFVNALHEMCQSPGGGPHFRFSTSQSAPTKEYPDPRVWENWHGVIADYTPPEDGGGVEDDTPPTPPKTSASSALKKPAVNGTSKPSSVVAPKAGTKKAPAPPPEPEVPFDEFGDLDSLVELAKSNDATATERLTEMAVAKGMTEDEVNNAGSWEEVRDYINGDTTTVTEGGEEGEGSTLAVGDVYKYEITDPKTKKSRYIEVEVLEIDEDASTVKAKNLENPKLKPFENVPFDKLEQA